MKKQYYAVKRTDTNEFYRYTKGSWARDPGLETWIGDPAEAETVRKALVGYGLTVPMEVVPVK